MEMAPGLMCCARQVPAQALVIAVCVDSRKTPRPLSKLGTRSDFSDGTGLHARAFDRIHAIELLERGRRISRCARPSSRALVFGGETLNHLLDDQDHVAEVIDFVRQRDEARFAYQLASSAEDRLEPVPAHILPEPCSNR